MTSPDRDALAAHDWENVMRLPELSNGYCLSSKAGGSPFVVLDIDFQLFSFRINKLTG
jgi:hypothetical protein